METKSYESYALTKNVIYQLHPVLKTMDEVDILNFFNSFKTYKRVAQNTYLFPYDKELSEDMKELTIMTLLDAGLQEKYNISSELLKDKYNEYKFFEYRKLLEDGEILDIESANRYHYSSKQL